MPVEMTNRQRFSETMSLGSPDRIPYFEEGLREEVLAAWRKQGMSPAQSPFTLFPTDRREEIQPDLDPRPSLSRYPSSREDLAEFERRLDPDDPGRLAVDECDLAGASAPDGHVNMLRIHRGFFLSMGVEDWSRFKALMEMLVDAPGVVRQAMEIQGNFTARLADRILSMVQADAAIFSEPIGGNVGPLISPRMYEDIVLPTYRPLMDVLQRHGVNTVIFRTYANARILIPLILKYGFNCLWACEVDLQAMDYRDLRREFGTDLRLIGGIDLDALRQGRNAIYKELTTKLPPLLAQGGYIPLADGRIREDVHYADYIYYRRLLQEILASEGTL